ncbi:MAG TPA: OmpA family protein [Prolixibacteraceae bacterium]|nr:OmpA family protein [Prolixibacteraceae bacterium]
MKTIQFLFVLLFSVAFINLNAQIDLNSKVKNQTNNKANSKVDQEIDKGLNSVQSGVKNLFKKKKSTEKPTEEQVQETVKETPQKEIPNEVKPVVDSKPPLQAYSKFDFIPGDKVIFFEDFSPDAVGDFPAHWNTNGSGEVVTTNLFPGKWLKISDVNTSLWGDKPLVLPDNYTIEFDVIPQTGERNGLSYYFRLLKSDKPNDYEPEADPGKSGFSVKFDYYVYFNSYFSYERTNVQGTREGATQLANQKYHISVWAQKERIRVYQNEVKIFDLPKALDNKVQYNKLLFEKGTPMISNIRIAVGAPDMRSKLITEGKLVSYGIYFDVNKDVVKPESNGTLKGIADVLNENPDVHIKIVGYTDSDGADGANLDLSVRRGASVKNELVKSFGIDASRLESDGLGETKPIAANDTPANKALNRRVEFLKL